MKSRFFSILSEQIFFTKKFHTLLTRYSLRPKIEKQILKEDYSVFILLKLTLEQIKTFKFYLKLNIIY